VAYGFNDVTFGNVAGNGVGETIAIVDAFNDPTIQADLNKFDSQFGLPAITVALSNETGGTSLPGSDSTGGWELEESLDVEWAHAMAPGASIMLVEATSNSDPDLYAAVKYASNHANIVSMSFDSGEFTGEVADDSQYFDKAGVAFVAASGDDGAPAAYPAASPDVLTVGGTALFLGTGSVWSSETGWSGSGGGPSADESQPSYQKDVVTQTTTQRADPDVAYDGSPSTGFAVYDSIPYNGTTYNWLEVGGTSAGAPQWSAILAIADEGRALSGEPVLDSTSPQEVMDILYDNTTDFHDITSGTSTGSPRYSAGPGYDYVTGLGSPMANLVVGSLVTPLYDKLVLTAPGSATAGTPFSLTVTAQNSHGQTDTGYTGTIHFTSSDGQAGLPGNLTFTAADQGTVTFMVTLKTAGALSVTATDTSTSFITGTLTDLSVSPAVASQFVISGISSTTTAGVPQTVTVTALDPYGNLATDFGGTVDLVTSDAQASLPATFTYTAVVAGVYIFPLTLETAGTQSVTVTDPTSGMSATLAPITVRPGPAQTFTIGGFPPDDTAGEANTVTVTAYDAYGNMATGYAGTVILSSSDPDAITASGPVTAGQGRFVVTLDVAGTQSITATDSMTPSLTATESNLSVNPAAASILKVTGFPTTDTAGALEHVLVTAYDPFGNVATGYAGMVSLSSSDPAVVPAIFAFAPSDAGTQSVDIALDTAGPQSITATDTANTAITGVESGITVLPGAATTLSIDAPLTSITAGTAFDVTVTAHDAYGNVATSYTGSVSLSSSDSRAELPAAYTFAGSDQGTHTFSVTLDISGHQSITAGDGEPSGFSVTDPSIAVQPAPAQILTVTGLPEVVMAGESDLVTVTANDAYGNVATGYSGTIAFGSSDPQSILPEPFSFIAADRGTDSFPVTFETVGSQSIAVTDTVNSNITGTEAGIRVRAIPQVTWNALTPIVYGTPLGGRQLDASASVPGVIAYTPAAGAILDAGSDQMLSLIFIPSDATDYTTATVTTTIAVAKATPTVKVVDNGGRFDGAPFPAVATIAGVVAGVDNSPSASLDGMKPILNYYVGSTTGGVSLGSSPPSAPGIYTVIAAVGGDTDYSATASAPVTFTIEKGAATLNLADSASSTVYGQSVSFIAKVAAAPGAGTPSGTVTFSDGPTALATITLDGSGTATFTIAALALGSHSITASYSGNADFLGTQSAASSATVARTNTELVMISTLIFKKRHRVSSVRLTAEVNPSAPGGGVPTGEVTFELLTRTNKKKLKVTKLGKAAVQAGEASVTLRAGEVLREAITIVYGGDANDQSSTLTAPPTN
jgi:hypothetical protein